MPETEKTKYHYDLTNVFVAEQMTDDETAGATYETPERVYGAVSMDLEAQGEITKFRADASDYIVTESNNGYEGDITFAMVPDWFRQKYLGNTLSTNDKVMTESARSKSKKFALLFEFLGDVKHRRHVLYSCLASRPNIKGENKDNQKEPDTESMTITASPLANGDVKASTTDDTPAEVYNGWNEEVWTKDTTTGQSQASEIGGN